MLSDAGANIVPSSCNSAGWQRTDLLQLCPTPKFSSVSRCTMDWQGWGGTGTQQLELGQHVHDTFQTHPVNASAVDKEDRKRPVRTHHKKSASDTFAFAAGELLGQAHHFSSYGDDRDFLRASAATAHDPQHVFAHQFTVDVQPQMNHVAAAPAALDNMMTDLHLQNCTVTDVGMSGQADSNSIGRRQAGSGKPAAKV